jgi:methyl-accepting chemotaxis protein
MRAEAERSPASGFGLQQLLGVFARGLADGLPAQHAGDLLGALGGLQAADSGAAAAGFPLSVIHAQGSIGVRVGDAMNYLKEILGVLLVLGFIWWVEHQVDRLTRAITWKRAEFGEELVHIRDSVDTLEALANELSKDVESIKGSVGSVAQSVENLEWALQKDRGPQD